MQFVYIDGSVYTCSYNKFYTNCKQKIRKLWEG